jgi:hypothetical protein
MQKTTHSTYPRLLSNGFLLMDRVKLGC